VEQIGCPPSPVEEKRERVCTSAGPAELRAKKDGAGGARTRRRRGGWAGEGGEGGVVPVRREVQIRIRGGETVSIEEEKKNARRKAQREKKKKK